MPRTRIELARRAWLLILLGTIVLPAPAAAHPGHDDDHPHHPAAPRAALPEALVLPVIEGPRPWSDQPALDDPQRFRIAIMTDRTGGHRPGIWEKGIEKVNLLRPDFVVSVGDLIEGYSLDRKAVEAEWREFLGFIDRLQMKFFFVAGNHDLSNPLMHDIWREHFGPEWYSFDYKGVHFVCLNSEDPVNKLGDKQLEWLRGDLQKHADARWTLLFLHKPLWLLAERELKAGNPDPTGWKQVEQLLEGRPHNVFAGHVHHYVQYDRNGTQYYHLATTGGGSRLRGIPYGEFDHVTWLTMEADGPRVAHLLLDGIVAPDAVTEQGIARFRSFLANAVVEVAPILVDQHEGLTESRIDLRLNNRFDKPVEVEAWLEGVPLRGLTVDPQRFRLTAAPGASETLAARLAFAAPVPVEQLQQTTLTVRLKALDEQPPLSAEQSLPVVIDQRFACPAAPAGVKVDGKLDEWAELSHSLPDAVRVLGASQAWTGPGDASVRFSLAHDAQWLYLAARVTDDAVLPDADRLTLVLDGRPFTTRLADSGLKQGSWLITVTPPREDGPATVGVLGARNGPQLGESQAFVRRRNDGYDLELAVPIEFVTHQQGAAWESFQATLVLTDVDEPGAPSARLLWRGSDQYDRHNTAFAHFRRAE